MSTHTLAQGTFVIERRYDADLATVWSAFADPHVKARWFRGPAGVTDPELSDDFRVGGIGVNDATFDGGVRSRYRATYTDIVAHERIVYTYDMWLDDRHASTSLVAVELTPDGDATVLTYTEHGVHLDGIHGPGPDALAGREHGSRQLLDALGTAILA